MPVLMLARWRLRRTWFFLFITMLGMVAAVIIACTVPLFSSVMATAGLRNTLTEAPDSADIVVSVSTVGLSSQVYSDLHDQFDGFVRDRLGNLVSPPQAWIQSIDFSLAPSVKRSGSLFVYGTSMQAIASHIAHLSGRLPGVSSKSRNTIEVAITPATARQLGLKIGSSLPLQLSMYYAPPAQYGAAPSPLPTVVPVTAHIVGLFEVGSANIAYWHGQDFQPQAFLHYPTQYSLLASNDGLLALLDSVSSEHDIQAVFSPSLGYALIWYYRLIPTRLSSSTLNTLINQLAKLHSDIDIANANLQGDSFQPAFPFFQSAQISGDVFDTSEGTGSLAQFQERVAIARAPVDVLTIQLLALVLFFVSIMATLLVEQQTDSIAMLRSRGASRAQVFSALLVQGVVLCIVAMLLGLPLALLVTTQLSQRILTPAAQNALNIITDAPLQAALGVLWYAAAVALAAIVALGISLFFATRENVLSQRREAARSSKRPLWQRLNADVVAGVIALAGYGISLYLANIGNILQPDAQALIAAPLSLIAPCFLLVGCLLLFLRIFPLLLRLGAWLAAKGRGALSMLALAHIARSPAQIARTTLLLSLVIAFAFFTFVYTASEAQHIQDVGTYVVGADFSSDIDNTGLNNEQPSLAEMTRLYQSIPGVISASVMYDGEDTVGAESVAVAIRAVDPGAFVSTVIWPSPEAAPQARTLLAQLVAERQPAIAVDEVPAIVNAAAAGQFGLQVGSQLGVVEDAQSGLIMKAVVVGIIPHIPTVDDRGSSGLAGLLVDYQTFSQVYTQDVKNLNEDLSLGAVPLTQPVNHVLLRTTSDPLALENVRLALKKPSLHLTNTLDRRAILAALTSDPLYLILQGVLGIGTIAMLVLALVGNMLAAWVSARARLENLAVLRALGTAPRQVWAVLIWEQAIVYVCSLVLGAGFGAIFAFTAIPALISVNANSGVSITDFYSLQSLLPAALIFPPSLLVALLVLVAIFVILLIITARLIAGLSLGQALRLSED